MPSPFNSVNGVPNRAAPGESSGYIPLSTTTDPKWRDRPGSILPSRFEFLLYLDKQMINVIPKSTTNWRMYAIPQTLYKLHPDLDQLIVDVLLADPSGYIFMPRGSSSGAWVDTVILRLKESIAKISSDEGIDKTYVMNRIIFLPGMTSRQYLTFIALADVVLDTFPVGGGRSSLEILSVGTPIVVLYPRTSILQLTAGMYQAMGLWEPGTDEQGRVTADSLSKSKGLLAPLVCADAAAYVRAVVKVGTDRTHQYMLRNAILARNHVLYTDSDSQSDGVSDGFGEAAMPNSAVEDWTKSIEYAAHNPRPLPPAEGWANTKAVLL
jgi:hypothetical protein